MDRVDQLNQWSTAHAGLMITSAIFAVSVENRSIILPIVGILSCAFIWIRQNRLRIADMVTGFRAAAASGGFILLAFDAGGNLFPLLLFITAEVSDFFDGFLSRKDGGTSFGARWDLEIDAFFILLLSVSAYLYGGVGGWVVIAGLLRYVFFHIYLFVTPVTIKSRALGVYMKTACVVAVILLIVANQRWLDQGMRTAAGLIALVFLSISFLWELAYYARGSQ